jgi:group I intron endonuclease
MIIYKITNLVNGKIYVGKDAVNNPKYLGSGLILENAVRKYGVDNFKKEILEECNSLEELSQRESFWINKLNSTNRKIGYNITNGGEGGDTFSNQSNERKKEILEKRSISSRDIFSSEEYRKKLSVASKKLWKNPKHKSLIIKKLTGRKIKWKDKISKSIKEWHKTNPITESGRRKMSEAGKKSLGKEIKTIPQAVKRKIISLYQLCGPKTISKTLKKEGVDISNYLIIRLLKKEGIYQKWQKGIKA